MREDLGQERGLFLLPPAMHTRIFRWHVTRLSHEDRVDVDVEWAHTTDQLGFGRMPMTHWSEAWLSVTSTDGNVCASNHDSSGRESSFFAMCPRHPAVRLVASLSRRDGCVRGGPRHVQDRLDLAMLVCVWRKEGGEVFCCVHLNTTITLLHPPIWSEHSFHPFFYPEGPSPGGVPWLLIARVLTEWQMASGPGRARKKLGAGRTGHLCPPPLSFPLLYSTLDSPVSDHCPRGFAHTRLTATQAGGISRSVRKGGGCSVASADLPVTRPTRYITPWREEVLSAHSLLSMLFYVVDGDDRWRWRHLLVRRPDATPSSRETDSGRVAHCVERL